jgi:signal transduction histidine kinase
VSTPVKDDGRRRWRSLTWQLAATYGLTTLLFVFLLGIAVHFLTAYYLNDRLDTELRAQSHFYAAYAAQLARDERTLAGVAPTIVELFAPQADLNVRFFSTSNGALLATTEDIGPQPSREALSELRYRSPTLFTQPSLDQPHRRYEATPVMVGERSIGVVEVSRSTLGIEGFLATLRQILFVIVVVAVAGSVLVSVLLARQLSGPVLGMEDATRQIAEGDLEIRLKDYPGNELGRLAESINHMTERLLSLETARVRFLSEISHDLRTPLTAIKGMLVNLIDDAEPGRVAPLQVVERETDRLIRLVNQLLDFSRWQGGALSLNLAPTDIAEVCTTAVHLNRPTAEHRGIELGTEIQSSLPSITADGDRLQRVVVNLLDNAIKFTPRGGRITLAVTEQQGAVQISVQDTGRGMSEEELNQALRPDLRDHGGGTGLGLSISRAIVEAHGGRMGIESSLDRGTRVWLSLPCNSRSFLDNTPVTS